MSRYKSLIKAITDAIQTGVGGNVSLNERTLLSHLLERKRGKSFFAKEKKEVEQPVKLETFVITRWLIRLISILLTCFLWLFTFVFYLPIRLIKGVDLRHFRVKSLLSIKCSPVINLVAVVIVLVLGIVFIVNMITVGVKDIMFAPVNMRVNSQGVITLDQPCMESHSFFLMNASTFWWPTDISMSKEDKVTVSVSGSMYSDIGEVCSAATNNRHLRYNRMFFAQKSKSDSLFDRVDNIGTSVCITPDAPFGTLLCQITNEHQAPTETSKAQIKKISFGHNCFELEQSEQPGVLYITFNDVFLTREIVRKMRESADSSTVVMKEDLEETGYFEEFDSGQLKTVHEEIWFNDNVGEYLVNIRVKKDIRHSNIPLYKKPIFIIYRRIEEHTMVYWIVWIVGAILLYVFLDCLVSYLFRKRHGIKRVCMDFWTSCLLWIRRRIKQGCYSKTSENASE